MKMQCANCKQMMAEQEDEEVAANDADTDAMPTRAMQTV